VCSSDLAFAMEAALDAGACDYAMPDLERIGGVTGWQRPAGPPAARGHRMSNRKASWWEKVETTVVSLSAQRNKQAE